MGQPGAHGGHHRPERTGVRDRLHHVHPDVSACSWSASPTFPAGVDPTFLAAVTAGVANQPTQVNVRVFTVAAAPALTDSSVGVQVLC